MRWISVPHCLQTCCELNFAKGPNVNGNSTKRYRKNIPSTILISIIPGLQEFIWFSSSSSSLDLVCFAKSHQDDTMIRKQESVYTTELLTYRLWLVRHETRCFPKRYLLIVTITSFLSDVLETLNLPAWVAKFLISCLFMGWENLSGSLTQSSMN